MSESNYNLAEQFLLQRNQLSVSNLDRVFHSAMGPGVDAVDIYFQHVSSESWSLEDGLVKDGSYSIEQGAGVRAIAGEKMALAYTDLLQPKSLEEAARAVRVIGMHGDTGTASVGTPIGARIRYQHDNPIVSQDSAGKVRWLRELDAMARALDPRIQQVMVSLSGQHEHMLLAHSDGTLAGDVRPLVHLSVRVIAEQAGRREQGNAGAGGRVSYQELFESGRAHNVVREAVRVALLNLEAISAPAGMLPVVLGPGWPGVLLHEAVGHGLEGDFNRKQTSAFSGRMGQMVASSLCTVVDDGTLQDRRGSLTLDDEGVPTQRTTLIENGVLTAYLQDKVNAGLMGTRSTGNGRRESFAHLPMPRMTNTYLLPGPHDPNEIIASVKRGLYARNFGGGQVDITNGRFVFSASEAYLIEDGKITTPVKGATLIGSGPEVMNQITMLGNDLQLDLGVGVCGKEGQSVPVGVGQPTLKIAQMTVGGTQAS